VGVVNDAKITTLEMNGSLAGETVVSSRPTSATPIVEVKLKDGTKKTVKVPPKKKNKKHKSVLQTKLGKLALVIGYIGK
jgi:hypothetical protein